VVHAPYLAAEVRGERREQDEEVVAVRVPGVELLREPLARADVGVARGREPRVAGPVVREQGDVVRLEGLRGAARESQRGGGERR